MFDLTEQVPADVLFSDSDELVVSLSSSPGDNVELSDLALTGCYKPSKLGIVICNVLSYCIHFADASCNKIYTAMLDIAFLFFYVMLSKSE